MGDKPGDEMMPLERAPEHGILKAMPVSRKRFILAVMALIGTIIGAGIFAVPYAMSTVGIGVTLAYFVVLTAIQVLQSLYFAEAVIACDENLRFPGLVKRYVGNGARHLATMSTVLGFWGALVAYIMLGGLFLHTLLSPVFGGTFMAYRLTWAVLAGFVVILGIEFVSRIEFVSTTLLFFAMTLIAFLAIPHAGFSNVAVFVPNSDLFLPYGVILFSLGGFAAIPEMEDILKNDHTQYRKAILIGQIIASALTFCFGLIVYGVTGAATSPDAVSGLESAVGTTITAFMAAFGFLAVASPFLIVGTNLRSTFEYDFRISRSKAFLLAVGVPLAFILLGIGDFVGVIGFMGAVFGGIGATVVVLLYLAVRKQHQIEGHAIRAHHETDRPLALPTWMAYVTMGVLVFGAAYSVYTSLVEWLA
jgi:amino acid permease